MDDKLIERMVALIRDMATSNGPCRSSEAAEIIALIDPPVDPDVLAAEEIKSGMGGGTITDFVVAGIKFGRAHALSDLAKLPDDRERARRIAESVLGGIHQDSDFETDLVLSGIAYGRAQLEPQRTIPPIEQDLIDAREIVAQVLENNSSVINRPLSRIAQLVRDGEYDHAKSVPLVLSHLMSRRKP